MPLIRLQKIAELNHPIHPKNIEVGHSVTGQFFAYPIIGQSFVVGYDFVTSIVTEIIDYDTFATLNSVYRITPIRNVNTTLKS